MTPSIFCNPTRRAPRADVAILLITFFLTVFADLVVAVNIGVTLAILQFLRRMADSVEVQQLSEQELKLELFSQGLFNLPQGLLVYEIDGPFFFGAVENFERTLLHTHSDPKILVLRLRHVPFMDATGLQTFIEVVSKLKQRSVRILVCEANPKVFTKLKKIGLFDLLEEGAYSQDFISCLSQADAHISGLALPDQADTK